MFVETVYVLLLLALAGREAGLVGGAHEVLVWGLEFVVFMHTSVSGNIHDI
jgi:hypothetical protein